MNRPDIKLDLIRIQTVWHFGGIPERFFSKKLILKTKSADENNAKVPSNSSAIRVTMNFQR